MPLAGMSYPDHARTDPYLLTPQQRNESFRLVYVDTTQGRPGERYRRGPWPYACFEWIVSGAGWVDVDGVHENLEAGDAYLLPPGKPHQYAADPDEPWRKRYMVVSGVLVEQLIGAHGLTGAVAWHAATAGAILDAASLLWREQPDDLHGRAAVLFHQLLVAWQRARAATPRYSPLVQAMVKMIDQHLEKPLRLDDLAQAVHRSTAYASRRFRREIGMPPYDYLIRRRVALACELLASTPLAVQAIAERLGYADAYYFSNAFKAVTGESPTAYRTRVGEKHASDPAGG